MPSTAVRKPLLVGREGLEPSMSSGTGATIRCGTNYALPTHIKKIKVLPLSWFQYTTWYME